MANSVMKELDQKFKLNHLKNKKGGTANTTQQIKLKELQDYLKNATLLNISFDLIEENGNMIFVDNEQITYTLSADNFRENFPAYTPDMRSIILGTPIQVRIKEIEGTQVVLECADNSFAAGGNALINQSKALERSLYYRINRKRFPQIQGTVTEVTEKQIFVDIYDTGVKGVVPTMHFRREYTRDLRDHYKPGDSITGRVIKKRSQGEGERLWIISTVGITPDPWKALPDVINEGSIINVKCIDIPEGKSYFWGTSNLAPGIEIMGDFGSGRRCKVEIGGIYRCKIRVCDKEQRRFQVVPFNNTAAGYHPDIRVVEETKKAKTKDTKKKNNK